jgi:hypothetical protein
MYTKAEIAADALGSLPWFWQLDANPSLTDISSRAAHLRGNVILHPASGRNPAR